MIWAVTVWVPAIAAAADEEGAASGDPQLLAHIVELLQQLPILRGRHHSVSRGPVGGLVELNDLRMQITHHVGLDHVCLRRGSYTRIQAFYLIDQACLTRAVDGGRCGVGASKRNGDEKVRRALQS